MGCCLALAYVVALVRRGWFAAVGGAPAPTASFAPPARRPAPGGTLVASGPAPAVAWAPPRSSTRARPTGRVGAGKVGAGTVGAGLVGAGLAWFVIGVVGMHALGWFAWAEASLLTDTAFHSSGLWLAAIGASVVAVRA
ncbi:hypothetical protein [Nocardioides stalactiti]|uniref:hypothetical protein n=1 Tax=Nocardioides stalactiti TaxID=2755356 RepID=UPI001603282D|nr:hypothetical protein [Nocardioides stalactiti]